MTKIDALRRFFLPCLHHHRTSPTPPPHTKKRLSASLRDDMDTTSTTKNQENSPHGHHRQENQEKQPPSQSSSTSSSPRTPTTLPQAPPRSSRTMVIGTIFGHRKAGHVWFCVQHNRLALKPTLLLELSIPTSTLIQEMQCGLVRIALEFNAAESDEAELARCPLHSVPVWTLFCNGRKLGFAVRRRATQRNRIMLRTMQNVSIGAGVIGSGAEEMMYMRANYEGIVGSGDSESFHLISPDDCPGQELSVFLLRTR